MDKAPDFGLPFFYRIVLPGAAVTLSSFPLVSALLGAFGIGGKDQAAYLVGLGILFGFTISLFDDPIYELLEGRNGWPKWLSAWRTRRWKKLVDANYKKQDTLEANDPEYKECWCLLRQFPVGADGNPTVTRPSRIGNVIASYEQYPMLRYGMDDVFYWPRIWLLVDKDSRSEIDNPWAAVDSILYSSCGVAAVGIVYLLLAVISFSAAAGGFATPIADSSLGVASLAGGLILLTVFLAGISIAVPGLVSNGENYKSVFDLYRSKLDLTPATQPERDRWTRLAQRLQYGDDDSE